MAYCKAFNIHSTFSELKQSKTINQLFFNTQAPPFLRGEKKKKKGSCVFGTLYILNAETSKLFI